jgi:hypothetical protein
MEEVCRSHRERERHASPSLSLSLSEWVSTAVIRLISFLMNSANIQTTNSNLLEFYLRQNVSVCLFKGANGQLHAPAALSTVLI